MSVQVKFGPSTYQGRYDFHIYVKDTAVLSRNEYPLNIQDCNFTLEEGLEIAIALAQYCIPKLIDKSE